MYDTPPGRAPTAEPRRPTPARRARAAHTNQPSSRRAAALRFHLARVERERRPLRVLHDPDLGHSDVDRAGELGAAELLHPGERGVDVLGAEVGQPVRWHAGRAQLADAAVVRA